MFRGSFFLGFSYSATPRNRFRQDAPGPCLNSLPGSGRKESACSAGDPGWIPGSGRPPGEGNGNPLQYCCLENPHGQRSLAGYGPWGRKELDTTGQQIHTTALPQVFRCHINKLSKMWWLELIIESANGCSQFCELGMCAGLSWAILLHSCAAALGQEMLFSWGLVWVWKAWEGITHMPGVLLEMSESLGSAGSLCLPGSPRAFPWGPSHRMGGLLTWQLCSRGTRVDAAPFQSLDLGAAEASPLPSSAVGAATGQPRLEERGELDAAPR